MKKHGSVVFVLHTHLPYVLHHGQWPHGTDWLCEAVAECYIPLLNTFNELVLEGINPSISIDISPVLCEQLEHPDFPAIFLEYCDNKVLLAHQDSELFRQSNGDAHQVYLAHFWQEWYARRKQEFMHIYNCSIVSALRDLQERGILEILTCGITHGYLPLLGDDHSVRMQMKGAVENYTKYFGKKPRGTWLPECAYRPSYEWKSFIPYRKYSKQYHRQGIEEVLADVGIEHFFVDQHLFSKATLSGNPAFSSEQERYSPLQPRKIISEHSISGNSAIAFARHQSIALQVWSGSTGYPGDPAYLDFHKKQDHSHLRYWRVTDNKADMQYKQLYMPQWVTEKTDIHAFHFVKSIESIVEQYYSQNGKQAVVCLPFDTELFGHWWFEGPEFLKNVIKGIHHSRIVHLQTSSECIDCISEFDEINLPEGSWGKNGNHEVWMNDHNQWTWEKIYKAEERFADCMSRSALQQRTKLQERILKQMMRELLLMQSSDWQFLITTLSAKDYAEQRFANHDSDFNLLASMYDTYQQDIPLQLDDDTLLKDIEIRNAVFSELSLDWWE